MEDSTDTPWLMQYRVLNLVNQCRRRVRDEFGVRLSLTDDDLRSRLARFAAESDSGELNDLMARIARELGEPETPTEPAAAPEARRMYRGRPLEEREPAPERGDRDPDRSAEPRPAAVIYRGRVVR